MLGEALRLIRVYHDVSQKELAGQLGISNSYLSEIESGKKMPSIELLQRYSDYFDIPMSSILFFSENVNHARKSERVRRNVSSKVLTFLKWVYDREAVGRR